ncbi:hypothetical protein Ais01nite_19350 [Asanoa ishikariensis]|nr:hypothetical protein Ais01nite_19350 [Asanoa ishikariensis]
MFRRLAALVAATVVAQVAFFGTPAAANTDRWEAAVAAVPGTKYARDAKAYITEAVEALRPHIRGSEDKKESRIDQVLADVGIRYFDGARLNGFEDADKAFGNLEKFGDFVEERLDDGLSGTKEQDHIAALVKSLTAVRQLADAAVQDAEATIGPFRANPKPTPVPEGLDKAFKDLRDAREDLAEADEEFRDADVEDAIEHAAEAWASGFKVLKQFGITYTGDRDADGVVDGVELRFGSSPLLVDSDRDELTDKFEITQLVGFTRPNSYDTDADAISDAAEDVDQDGLTNLDEQRIGTSPTNPDTDGDGVNDGTEVSRGSNPLVADQPRGPPLPGDVPPINPQPTGVDTDGDGVPDLVEEDNGSDPAKPDTDGDGLSDGTELDYLISALFQDTDGDGLRDDYEIANAESQGLHPSQFDEQISKWTYVSDFLLGMFAGDFAEKDSMAWLAGNLCGGGLSVIPVVGWILGGLADIRDTIAALIHADWVSAGLSILGVIPYVGDAVSIPAKVVKFVNKYAHRLMAAARYVAKYDKIPDTVKELTYELMMPEVWNYLVVEQVEEPAGLVSVAVASSRVSKGNFDRLLNGKRTDLKRLQEMMTDGPHENGPKVAWAYGWTDGEDNFAEMMQGIGRPGERTFDVKKPDSPDFKGPREVDYAEETDEGWIFHEVKSGFAFSSGRILEQVDQCKKDAWYQDRANQDSIKQANQDKMKGKGVKKVHWHFVASGSGQPNVNDLGMSEELYNCLKENNITYTIHFPAD